ENLIAFGEHPVLIDLEALFHPRPAGIGGQNHLALAVSAMGHSVLRIGLLPQKLWGNANAEGIELSGIGGAPGQLTPHRIAVFENETTDRMRMVRKHLTMAGA